MPKTKSCFISFLFSLFSFFFFLFSFSLPSLAASISPECQQAFANPQANPTDTASCLVTGYISPEYLSVYENESSSKINNQKIVSQDVAEGHTCQDISDCPVGTAQLEDGTTIDVEPVACQKTTASSTPNITNNPNHPQLPPEDIQALQNQTPETGTCTYRKKLSYNPLPKALDFAAKNKPLSVSKVQQPLFFSSNQGPDNKYNLAANGYFNLMLPLCQQHQLRLSILGRIQDKPELYLNALPANYQTNCPQFNNPTLKQIRDQLPSYLTLHTSCQILNRLDPKTNTLLSCVPITPIPQGSLPSQSGLGLASLHALGASRYRPSSYNASPHANLFSALSTQLSLKLPLPQLQNYFDQLQTISPITQYFQPDAPPIKIIDFVKQHPPTFDAIPAKKLTLRLENRDTKPNPYQIQLTDQSQIQEADAEFSPPNFFSNITALILNIINNLAEKHFFTIPAPSQQLANFLLKPLIQLNYPLNLGQQLISQNQRQTIALKGSKYSGGLNLERLNAAQRFSAILPQNFKEYCTIDTTIEDYVLGRCVLNPKGDQLFDLCSANQPVQDQYKLQNLDSIEKIKANPLSDSMINIIEQAAQKYQVPSGLILGIMYAEGGFQRTGTYGEWKNFDACSSPIPNCDTDNDNNTSSAGAIGPYQIIPSWENQDSSIACDFPKATEYIAQKLRKGLSAIPDLIIMAQNGQLDKYSDYIDDLKNGGQCDNYQYLTLPESPTGQNWSKRELITAARYHRGTCDPEFFNHVIYIVETTNPSLHP